MFFQATEETEKDISEGRYGNLPLIQSRERIDRKVLDLKELNSDLADKKVWVRARLQTSRSKGVYLIIMIIVIMTYYDLFFMH